MLGESYQSFSTLNYSQNSSTVNQPEFIYSQKGTSEQRTYPANQSKWDYDSLALFSQYYFEEQQSLGPLNEFDYINTSSTIYALVSKNSTDFSSSYAGYSSWDSSDNTINIGGQWISHNFLLGAGYSYVKSKSSYGNSYDYNSYSASLGYFLLDNLVIRADYFDSGDDYDFFSDNSDYFSYSASYNLQLAGTDYIGFSYNVDENFDIHQLSSRYFLALTGESYLVLGGDYTIDNSDNFLADDSWSINSSYYFNTQTSVSAFYGKDDVYGIGANYFINDNYSVQASYNANNNDNYEVDLEGYSLSFSAQF